MKLKLLTASILSLGLIVSSTGALAAAPATQAAKSSNNAPEVTAPHKANASDAGDIAKKRRRKIVWMWIGGALVAVAIVAASHNSNSGTTGTTVP